MKCPNCDSKMDKIESIFMCFSCGNVYSLSWLAGWLAAKIKYCRPTKVAVGRRVGPAKKAKSTRKAGSGLTVDSPRRR